MTISEIMEAMIKYSEKNLHDINHFVKVYTYASLIGKGEKLDERTQHTLEIAALVHDIACPYCREKYGNTNGEYQEKEGIWITKEFLADKGLTEKEVERIAYLVGHHHTYKEVEGMDYQILLEADFLVNADESHMSATTIQNFKRNVFKTDTGCRLLEAMY